MTTRRTGPVYSTPLETQGGFAGDVASAFATQDLAGVRAQLEGIDASARNVSTNLTKAFSNASASSRAFSATLSGVASALSQTLASAGAGLLNQGLASIVDGLASGANAGPSVAPFADGGIVASPTFFASGGGLGLMGERGAEAILPLARGPNGQLGIAATDNVAPRQPIVVHIHAQDADGFRKSEGQVAAALARAVARGRRGL